MLDFDLLLESVYPHQMFTEFIKSELPNYLPYLQLVRKMKLIEAKRNDLDTLIYNESEISQDDGPETKRNNLSFSIRSTQ